jgi:ribosomal protein S18 acetylase RimI-like enzyme
MNENYLIIPAEKPTDEMWEVIGYGIHNYNVQQAGESQRAEVCFIVQSPEGKVVGGLIGETHWDWLYINLLFVKDELRGRGFGQQLLTLAEEKARQLGVKSVYLDTFSFQAPEFYRRNGYRVFGELNDFPPGHTRYYMTKQL